MVSYFLAYPLAYLTLRTERGTLVLWRDVVPVGILSSLLILSYLIIPGANFFAKDGFVDRSGSVTTALTGFYIAGLLAVATFTASKASLDEPIKVGPVYFGRDPKLRLALSRRDYVCLIFGYLSIVSLIISLSSVLITTISSAFAKEISGMRLDLGSKYLLVDVTTAIIAKAMFCIIVSHLMITTGYGLYYLTKKIYDREATLKKKG